MPTETFYAQRARGQHAHHERRSTATNAARVLSSLYLQGGRRTFCIIAFSVRPVRHVPTPRAIAREELREEYPERKVDRRRLARPRRCGEGLLVYHAAVQGARQGQGHRGSGRMGGSVKTVLKLGALVHGGRPEPPQARRARVRPQRRSSARCSAIKPVLHVDDEGHLIPVEQSARTPRESLDALVEHMAEDRRSAREHQTVFISHGDCVDRRRTTSRTRSARRNIRREGHSHRTPSAR